MASNLQHALYIAVHCHPGTEPLGIRESWPLDISLERDQRLRGEEKVTNVTDGKAYIGILTPDPQLYSSITKPTVIVQLFIHTTLYHSFQSI